MAVTIIDTLKQHNDGDFPLVEAHDISVEMPNGQEQRLQELINSNVLTVDAAKIAEPTSTPTYPTRTMGAYVGAVRANRLNGLPAANVCVEVSHDSGATWLPYDYISAYDGEAMRYRLLTGQHEGKVNPDQNLCLPLAAGVQSTEERIRITICLKQMPDMQGSDWYAQLNSSIGMSYVAVIDQLTVTAWVNMLANNMLIEVQRGRTDTMEFTKIGEARLCAPWNRAMPITGQLSVEPFAFAGDNVLPEPINIEYPVADLLRLECRIVPQVDGDTLALADVAMQLLAVTAHGGYAFGHITTATSDNMLTDTPTALMADKPILAPYSIPIIDAGGAPQQGETLMAHLTTDSKVDAALGYSEVPCIGFAPLAETPEMAAIGQRLTALEAGGEVPVYGTNSTPYEQLIIGKLPNLNGGQYVCRMMVNLPVIEPITGNRTTTIPVDAGGKYDAGYIITAEVSAIDADGFHNPVPFKFKGTEVSADLVDCRGWRVIYTFTIQLKQTQN